MVLKKVHRQFCQLYIDNDSNATQAYLLAFPHVKTESAGVLGHRLIKKPEIIEYIEYLSKRRLESEEQQYNEERRKLLEEKKKGILNDIDLDFFHSQIVRGEVEFEEIMPVRETIFAQYDSNNKLIAGTGRTITTFKKIKRPPTIKERQASSLVLYSRLGLLGINGKPLPSHGMPDNDYPDIDSSNSEPEQRFIELSNGEKIPIPNE